jgi:hypothetical protein
LIQLPPESPEELRKRLQEMSDLELRRFGQRARQLSDPKTNFGATEPHVGELEEARAERREDTQNCTEPRVGKSHWAHGEIALPKRAKRSLDFQQGNSVILICSISNTRCSPPVRQRTNY